MPRLVLECWKHARPRSGMFRLRGERQGLPVGGLPRNSVEAGNASIGSQPLGLRYFPGRQLLGMMIWNLPGETSGPFPHYGWRSIDHPAAGKNGTTANRSVDFGGGLTLLPLAVLGRQPDHSCRSLPPVRLALATLLARDRS